NWHPDGERLVINLRDGEGDMRFHEVRDDGSGPRVLVPHLLGSGHPSYSGDGRFLLTDAYPREPVCRDGMVPLRLIDLEEGTERVLCWMWTLGDKLKALRVDPHPVWNREFTKVCFTGAPEGNRQLFIADLEPLGERMSRLRS